MRYFYNNNGHFMTVFEVEHRAMGRHAKTRSVRQKAPASPLSRKWYVPLVWQNLLLFVFTQIPINLVNLSVGSPIVSE